MHVGDTIFIFCLALIIFGPKKLPEIGRQIGKLMVEFRRASNEFKMQIEDELRAAEEAERQKEITAATTMLPSATAGVAGTGTAPAPVIAPPSIGLPVNHTFASPEPETIPEPEAIPTEQPAAENAATAETPQPEADHASLPVAHG